MPLLEVGTTSPKCSFEMIPASTIMLLIVDGAGRRSTILPAKRSTVRIAGSVLLCPMPRESKEIQHSHQCIFHQ